MGKRVIARTNLAVFFEQGMESFPEFYRDHEVELIASLPCYLEQNVNAIRGNGVYQKSIDGLRKLNSLGYGDETGKLSLSLVYNPAGPFLAPPQSSLEADYKRELKARYGIVSRLLLLPICRSAGSKPGQERNDRSYLTCSLQRSIPDP
jgi:radical SAM/Cys-rich protein